MAQWIIYYSDGSSIRSFSSGDGAPEDAPRHYVQIVMQKHPTKGVVILHGSGNDYVYFCWHGNQWRPHTQNGLEQYLDAPGKEKVRLCGYWIDDETFWDIIALARRHPDFQLDGNQPVFEPRLKDED